MTLKAHLTPVRRFLEGLTGTVARKVAAVMPVTEFIYAYLEEDRTFTASEYPGHPEGGVWTGCTTPWIADIHSVPPSWSWTPADLAGLARRTAQIKAADAYIQRSVPSQRYAGTAAQILQQRFTRGMWSPEVFAAAEVDALVGNWIDDDAEFARQRLGGANPYIIAKYQGTAASLTDAIARSAGARDREGLAATLSAALARGALFVCDYRPILGGVARERLVRAGRHFTVPLVFFVVDGAGGAARLMPAAIQLDAPGDGYLFTPADDANAWLLAKLWAASADAQAWFVGTHIFRTHSIGAIFGIAALQVIQRGALSPDHPMVTLMQPHLRKVFDINHFIYDAKAYARGGRHFGIYQRGRSGAPSLTDAALPAGRIGTYQIIHDLYEGYTFDGQAFDASIADRGVGAEDLPVFFPFRDDGAVWWDAIRAFVSEVVDATYASDTAVAADVELGAWMALVDEAFNQGGAARFTWEASRAGLARILANALFLCSVQHAAVNDAQFDQSAFIPNGAYAMTAPPPTGPGVTDAELLASLPDPQVLTDGAYAAPIVAQLSVAMAGTSPVTDVAAGEGTPESLHEAYPFAAGSAQHAAVARFYEALWTGPGSVRARIAAGRDARVAACSVRPAPKSVVYRYLDVHLIAGDPVNAPVTRCIQV